MRIDEVEDVIDYFRGNGVYFLHPYQAEEQRLSADSRIDLSHESLTRNWQKYKEWIAEEATARQSFAEVVIAASRYYAKPRAGRLWQDPELSTAEKLRASHGWNNAWSELYSDGSKLEAAEEFLRKSSQQRSKAAIRKWVIISVIVFVVVLCAIAYAIRSKRDAAREVKLRNQAVENAKRADNEAKAANLAKVEAVNAALTADQAREEAKGQARAALLAEKQAESDKARADRSERAELQTAKALQSELTNEKALRADVEQRSQSLAVANAKLADTRNSLTAQNEVLKAQRDVTAARSETVAQTSSPERSSTAKTVELLISAVKELSHLRQPVSLADITTLRMLLFDSLSLQEVRLYRPVTQIALTHRMNLLALADDGSVIEYPTHKPETFGLDSWEYSTRALSSDGNYLAAGGVRDQVQLASILTNGARETVKVIGLPITRLGFSSSGKRVFFGAINGSWDEESVKAILEQRVSHRELAFSRFGSGVAFVFKLTFHLAEDSYPIRAFAADDLDATKTVAILDESGRVATWRNHKESKLSQGSFRILIIGPLHGEFTAFGPDKAYRLAVGNGEQAAFVTDPGVTYIGGITSAQWNSSGSLLALGYNSGTLRILSYDATTSRLRLIVEIPAHAGVIEAISWQDHYVATGSSDGTAKLWDVNLTSSFNQLLADLNILSQYHKDIDLNEVPGFSTDQFFRNWNARLQELRVKDPSAGK